MASPYANISFTAAGGKPATHIPRWDIADWQKLSRETDADVYAIAVDGFGNVYMGREFTQAGGVLAYNIAIRMEHLGWHWNAGMSNDPTPNA